jgi:hypothetical protein
LGAAGRADSSPFFGDGGAEKTVLHRDSIEPIFGSGFVLEVDGSHGLVRPPLSDLNGSDFLRVCHVGEHDDVPMSKDETGVDEIHEVSQDVIGREMSDARDMGHDRIEAPVIFGQLAAA